MEKGQAWQCLTPGGTPWNSWWAGQLPGSPLPDPISNQKSYFPHPFSYLVSKIHNHFQKLCDQFRTPTKRFLKIQLIFAYYSFFVIHLALYIYISDSRTKWAKVIPVFRLKRPKTYPLGQHIPI